MIPPRTPEVLAPAGNLATLKTAIDFGADAVYAGGQSFGMRTAPKNFTLDDFATAVTYAHERGARIYVTANILPANEEISAMNAYIAALAEIGVDALIVTDIGVLMAARQIAPQLELHISTQAGVTNYQAANALHQLGASRVVLARELDLEAIRTIRANVSADLDIEAFVHGSMCMAFSGRCLISKHVNGRDANHGDCVQPCRWKYHVVEEKNPSEFLPVEVTEQGTFIFNSNDMNMLQHIPDVIDAGVTSLKIEGRAKGAYYVAAMANAYKSAVTVYMRQREQEKLLGESPKPVEFPRWLLEEPYKVTHRAYSTGFYYPDQPASEEIVRGGYINDWRLLGEVLTYNAGEQRVYLRSRNKITPGMEIEFLAPGGEPPIRMCVANEGLRDADGNEIEEINNPAHEFSMPCASAIPAGAMIRTRV